MRNVSKTPISPSSSSINFQRQKAKSGKGSHFACSPLLLLVRQLVLLPQVAHRRVRVRVRVRIGLNSGMSTDKFKFGYGYGYGYVQIRVRGGKQQDSTFYDMGTRIRILIVSDTGTGI